MLNSEIKSAARVKAPQQLGWSETEKQVRGGIRRLDTCLTGNCDLKHIKTPEMHLEGKWRTSRCSVMTTNGKQSRILDTTDIIH